MSDEVYVTEIEELEPGPHGFQREPGFELLGEDAGDPIVIPVVAVRCRSDIHPAPQYRYLSPHEMARGVMEVADRIFGVRVHGRLVVGRTDDIAEVARDEAHEIAEAIGLRGIARVLSWLARIPSLVRRAVARL